MLLVIQNRGATNDIDAYFAVEPEAIRQAVAEIATERGLPADWLNDAVKGFIHRRPDSVNLWASYPGLNIHAPSPRYIFAMKAEAARAATSDFEDLRALRRWLRLETLDQALAVVEEYIPADRLSMRTKLTLETLFEEDG